MTPQVPPEAVLILRLSALGDILHTLPAVAALRKAWPGTRIGWVVEKRAAMLLAGNPLVDHLHIIDTRAARRTGTLWPTLQGILRQVRDVRRIGYELALDFQGLFKSAVLARLSGAGRQAGFSGAARRERLSSFLLSETIQPASSNLHVIQLNNELVRHCGVPISEPWEFPLPETTQEALRVGESLRQLGLSEFAILNPGGGWITKTWKAWKYAELSKRLQDELGLPSLFTWGPGEEELISQIRNHLAGRRTLGFPTTFLELIPLIRRSRLFVGGDTGPMQLAAALGTPIVAIFGPTTPSRNGPFFPADITVHHPLHCSNCYYRTCPYKNECMEISVDEVFQAVVQRLLRQGGDAAAGKSSFPTALQDTIRYS
jgi:heptosyltransferase I